MLSLAIFCEVSSDLHVDVRLHLFRKACRKPPLQCSDTFVSKTRLDTFVSSDSSLVTREHPFQLSGVYIAQRLQYCIPGTTCSYFVLFCQNTAHKIIRNNALYACVRRMHTFGLYDVSETLVKRCSFFGDIQIVINYKQTRCSSYM